MLYKYYLKDHLGNTRVIFSDTNNDDIPEILQEADYYPFGMRHQNTTATNHYLYNGKELNTDLGLDWYDYGARWLDVETGRWSSIDPLAESYASMSPFNYVENNPITNTDPDGRSTHTDRSGNVVAVYDDKDLGIYMHDDLLGNQDIDGIKSIIDQRREYFGNSGGGIHMGESLHTFSFTDFGELEKGNIVPRGFIDFDSYWALERVSYINKDMRLRSLDYYGRNAGNNQKYDIKSQAKDRFGSAYYGSILYNQSYLMPCNVYASARDAGNFAAGIQQECSMIPNYVVSVGFGAYNHSRNSKWKGALHAMEKFFLDMNPDPFNFGPASPLKPPYYGEDIGTARAIELGREYHRKWPRETNLKGPYYRKSTD